VFIALVRAVNAGGTGMLPMSDLRALCEQAGFQNATKDAPADLVIPGREEAKPSGREVLVHYPDRIGRSKLKVLSADQATARNLNTVRKLLELSPAVSDGRTPSSR
jgi:uncharacterized protein (DUF1697 family)